MKYSDLNKNEKAMCDFIDDIFMKSILSRPEFVKVLALLINKYKLKKVIK